MNRIIANLMMSTMSSPPPASSSNEGPSSAAWITLMCGVLSWFMLPLIAAVVGIFLGRKELSAIKQGRSPAAGETITMVGYYASIANIVLAVVGGCASVVIVVLVWGGLIAGVGGLAIFGEIANSLQ